MMPLEPGSSLGAYSVIAKIGEGGMGEVYQARDTKLDRDVALKVLPEAFTSDPDRLARFEREAKVLASLNHPNIGSIYGLEEAEGVKALVLELIEGPTLADRIKQGAIPIDEALSIAKQIAEALEAAHEQGVIHRDLKPANVKVKADGTVKVLDFGLAKALDPAPTGDPDQSPTLTAGATQMGVIMGTAAYMSPEQARGEPVDKRADIWSFGCVLYELLTGRAAFDGDGTQEILASVINGTIDQDLLPPHVDPTVRRVLSRCLERDTKQRFRDIGDVRYELDQVLADPDGGVVSVARARPRSKWPWVVVSAVAVVIASVAVSNLKLSDSRPIGRFDYELPDGRGFRSAGRPVVAMSPDGQHFVYNGTGGLYLRSMDLLDARLIPGTEDPVTNPVFSPDGQDIAFWGLGGLMKISVRGGTPVTLADADAVGNPFGMSWESDGTILFGQTDGIWQVSENGGTPVRLIATDARQQAHGPQLLPGGEWVLYTLTSASGAARWNAAQVVIESLTSAVRHVLVERGRDARYVSTGHLVYALNDELLALPFDLDSLEPGAGPVSVIQGMARAYGDATNTGSAFYSFSEGGTLVYVPTTSARGLILVTVDRDGNIEPLTDRVRSYSRPRVSPDGSRIAVEVSDREQGVTHIWLIDVSTGNGEQFTFEGSLNEMPIWTADSRTVLFRSDRLGDTTNAIFSKSADLSGAAVPIVERGGVVAPTDLSSDNVLVFHESSGDAEGDDIWTVDIDGPDLPEVFLATSDAERAARFSSDGRWLAYVSDQSGELRVYVRPYPATDAGPRQIADEVRFAPVWSPDGAELYTIGAPTTGAPPRHLIATAIQTSPSLLTAGSQPLFASGARGLASNSETTGAVYDVMPAGERFVWVAVAGAAEATENTGAGPRQINIITNWFQELLERVPIP